MSDPTSIPLSLAIPIASSLVAAIGGLVVAIKWLATAKDKAEQGRLEDLRASSALVRETSDRVLPVLERVAIEMRIRNERAARRRESREGDSDPPDRLEDTATRLRRISLDRDRGRDQEDSDR